LADRPESVLEAVLEAHFPSAHVTLPSPSGACRQSRVLPF